MCSSLQTAKEESAIMLDKEQIKKECHESRTLSFLDTTMQDIRHGWRLLRKSPGFAAAAVLSLALGIGANTAVFSVIEALMLRALPVQNPEQLVRFTYPEEDFGFSYPAFLEYRELGHVFSGVSAISVIDRSVGTQQEQVRVGLVSGSYFSTLGVNATIGRTLMPEDDRMPGGHPLAVISHSYWQSHFAGSSDAVGRTLTLNGTSFTILGVASPGFSGDWVGRPTDLWIPLAMQAQAMPERPDLLTNPGPPWLRIVARLKSGATIEQAQAAVQTVYLQTIRDQQLDARQLRLALEAKVGLEPAGRGFSPQRKAFAQPLAILMIVVGLVLLIACANVANLLLARSAARTRELAIRVAIGAGRIRLIRQLLTESLLLAALGGAFGLLLAAGGTSALARFAGSGVDAVQLDTRLDWRVLIFTAVLCLSTGILFGIVPARRAGRVSPVSVLGGRSAGSDRRSGLSRTLVISQVALSLVLLTGAGLFLQTLRNLSGQDLGFDREHVLLVWTAPGQAGRSGQALVPFFAKLPGQIGALPEVRAASVSTNGLLNASYGSGPVLRVEGYTGPEPAAAWNVVAPRYFESVGMRLLLGRDFTGHDTEGAPHVAVVNKSMAYRLFGSGNPIGRRFGKGRESGYPWEIVGVVNDAKDAAARDQGRMMFYVPYGQDVAHLRSMCLTVRTSGSPNSAAAQIREQLHSIDPNLPVLKIDTIEQQLDSQLVQDRLISAIAGFFGVLAVLLACLGLYGVMSYMVARRTNEIGVRMAMGATRGQVLTRVLQESLALVAAGILIGLPATIAAARLIANRLFGVGASDPATIGSAVLLLIAVAALAGLLPARRASKVDPMVALRYE
jgi:predicted permease